ncbi:MAG: hypothetical protein EP305_08140 [Bacteroidetes bacterium]|nr:MAG: hypothetical protein EP305_08140 [Bacteroidota bacterium]
MSEFIEPQKRSNTPFIVIIFLLLIGIAGMAVLWSKKNSELNDCSNENATLLSDMEGMNKMMEGYVGNMSHDLKTDFQNMMRTYDELIKKDKSKADSLNAQKEKIQNLIDELNTNKKISASQLYKMKKENETLRNIMKGYVRQIDSLHTLNVKLSSDLDRTSTELQTTKGERDQYKQDAEQSAEQVRKGSKLSAYGFASEGLKMKLNNTTEVTNRARNTVMIRSSFTIGENPITKAGNKVVYMQIIGPDGKTMQTKSSNVTQVGGNSVAYSDAKEINYNNQSIDVTVFYDLKGEEADKGNYKVKIYCDGNLIGTDSFTLK